jgi:hypothetical protein
MIGKFINPTACAVVKNRIVHRKVLVPLFCVFLISCSSLTQFVDSNSGPVSPSTTTLAAQPTSTARPSSTPSPSLMPTETLAPRPTYTPAPTPTSPFAWETNNSVFFQKVGWGDLFVDREDGNQPINLTEGLSGKINRWGCRSWGRMCVSPDENWVVVGRFDLDDYTFTGDVKNSTPVDVWLIKTDGTFRQMLYRGTPDSMALAVWSPDSSLFTTNCPIGDNPYGVCITRVTDTDIEVTHTGFVGQCMTLSPDGKFYVMQGSQIFNIYGAEADQWPPRQIARIPTKYRRSGLACMTMWSPDSQSAIFMSPGGNEGIEYAIFYKVAVDGSGVEELVELDGYGFPPDQSPDGTKFSVWLTPSDSLFPELVVLSIDGTILLSFDTDGVIENKDPYNAGGPDPGDIYTEWTADGKQIVLNYNDQEFVIDVETGQIITR